MKILSRNKSILQSIALCRSSDDTTFRESVLHICFGILAFVLLFCAELSCVSYIMFAHANIEGKIVESSNHIKLKNVGRIFSISML